MKRLLIAIGLLVACGDASSAAPRAADNEGAGGEGGAGGEATFAECVQDSDCQNGLVCLTYQSRCVRPPKPVPCEAGEVWVEVNQALMFDANGTPHPHQDPFSAHEVFTNQEDRVYGNGGIDEPNRGYEFTVFEGGDPLTVNVDWGIVNFEIFNGFEVDFNGEMTYEGSFECTFTAGEMIEGDGEVVCEQDGYQLHVYYEFDPVVCGYE